MVAEFHPRPPEDKTAFKRSDAQLVMARFYGFPSWNALRDHVAEIERYARPDTADAEHDDVVDRFVALSCVSYGHDRPSERVAEAAAMLEANPDLASATPASMAVAGNHGGLANHFGEIDKQQLGDAVDEPCGPNQWSLLLYAAYSRVSIDAAGEPGLETVRLLLELGANPNAGFLWRGLVPPFTALTGAFGWGECDQPAHRDRLELARILLEAGADPNDGQALYNNGLAGSARDDHSHLELLVDFGLGTDQGGPWYERFGSRLTSPDNLLYDELEVAAHRGLPGRMRFLVGLGLDLQRGVGRSNLTPMALATAKGHEEIIGILAAAGATG